MHKIKTTCKVNNNICKVLQLRNDDYSSQYRVAQKLAPFLYALILPNINRFSKLFHCQNQQKICNDIITKEPTAPQVCLYTTL